MLDITDKFQFGPHRLKVVAMSGKGFDDPDRMVTAKCVETCCSDPMLITMAAHELEFLAKEYTDKIKSIKMRNKLVKYCERHSERPIDEQFE